MLNEIKVSSGFMNKLSRLLRQEARDARGPEAEQEEPQAPFVNTYALVPSVTRRADPAPRAEIARRPRATFQRRAPVSAGSRGLPQIPEALLLGEPLAAGITVPRDGAIRNPFSPAMQAHLRDVMADALTVAPNYAAIPREAPSLVPRVYAVTHYIISPGTQACEVPVRNAGSCWGDADYTQLVDGGGKPLARDTDGRVYVNWEAMTPQQFCQLPAVLRLELIEAMRGSKVRVSYNTGDHLSRNFTHEMSLDAYFAMKNADDVENDAVALLLATGTPSIAKQLTAHAWGIFNSHRVATALANLIADANVPDMSVVERQRARDQMAVVGSSIVAAYINNFRSRQKHKQDDKEVNRVVADVNQLCEGMPKGVVQLLSQAVLQTEGLTQGTKCLYDAVFQGLPAGIGSQAHTDFMALLMAGAQRYTKFAKTKSEKNIEHTSTAMAFFFALAGFIPVAGQFMGLAGLVADKTLHASWKPKDATALMDYVEAAIGSVLRAHVCQESGNGDRALKFATDWQDTLGVAKPLVWGDADFPLWRRLTMISKKGG